MCQVKGAVLEETLEVLRGKTIAVDADLLLRQVRGNPKKSLQEGHCGLDMSVQNGISRLI